MGDVADFVCMSVVYPNPKVAARWAGALEASLRQAPLERFLRSRGLRCAPQGEARLTDNLACAGIHLLQSGILGVRRDFEDALPTTLYPALGQVACTISHGLATLVGEPGAWRIAALVATARVLAPHGGLDAAAHIAAASARDFAVALNSGTQADELLALAIRAINAVETNDDAALVQEMAATLRRQGVPHDDTRKQGYRPSLTYDPARATSNSV